MLQCSVRPVVFDPLVRSRLGSNLGFRGASPAELPNNDDNAPLRPAEPQLHRHIASRCGDDLAQLPVLAPCNLALSGTLGRNGSKAKLGRTHMRQPKAEASWQRMS